MDRKSFLKLLPVSFLGLWKAGGLNKIMVPAELGFQQNPPIDSHYADRVPGAATAITLNGVGFVVDMADVCPLAKVVYGYLYLQDKSGGRGNWFIETRPAGLLPFPPDQGWQYAYSHFPAGNQIGFQMFARCGNDGRFEARVTRLNSVEFEWSFAPVWWWE